MNRTRPISFSSADRVPIRFDQTRWILVLVSLGVAIIAILAMYWGSVIAAVNVWYNSDTYSFAFLVAPVSLYIIWDRRHRLAGFRANPLWVGLLLFVPCGLLWLLSEAAELSMGRQLAVLGMLQALLLSVLGWRIYKALLFPFLYLWLLVPSADVLLPGLQLFVTRATVAGLNLLAVPSTSEGILIVADGAPYRIIEQCASLDFLLGSLAFSLVYANLLYSSFKRRAVFVAAALATAVAANLFRTTSIIFLTDVSGGRIDLASDHQLYGWIIFLVAIIGLMAVGLRFRENLASTSSDTHALAASGPIRRASYVLVAIAAVLLAGIAPAYSLYSLRSDMVPTNLAMGSPPAATPWQAIAANHDWQPVFPRSDLQLAQRYVASDQAVDLFIAYYWRQRPEAELVAWDNQLADRVTWHALSSVSHEVVVEGRRAVVTESQLLAKKQRRRLVWHWYWIDGRFVTDQLTAKLMQTKTRLLDGEQRAAFIAVSVEESDGVEAARARLRSFLASALTLTPCLKGTGPAPTSC